MSEPTPDAKPFPHSAADYSSLYDGLTTLLQQEVTRISALPDEERDIDREAVRALFDQHGFGAGTDNEGGYFGLDFEAPLLVFLMKLVHIHEDQLPSWNMIMANYPDGPPTEFNRDDMVSAKRGKDWHPED